MVLEKRVQLANVRTANIRAARAVGSKVSYLLLLLPVVRLVWALRPREIRELAATVAQMVGGNVGSTARASGCYAAQVRTARAASK